MANSLSVLTAVGLALGAGAALRGQAVLLSPDALHALNRITYGPTLPLLAQLTLTPTTPPSSIDLFVDSQTNPGAITEDPRVPALLAQLSTPRATIQEVKQEQFIRACFSKRQLQEVMTQFWQRHFNANYLQVNQVVQAFLPGSTEAVRFVDETNQAYRQLALGRFEDLLIATLRSRAMICYLSLHSSKSGPGPNEVPNEDEARESLELWTLGPEENGTPNYDHDDIENLAECLAGWNVWRTALGSTPALDPFTGASLAPQPLDLVFLPTWHENGVRDLDFAPNDPTDDLTLQGVSTSGADALVVMAHLARMEQTKRFVCRKLIDFFLADGAAAVETALLNQCVAAWGTNGGDIDAVLRVILKSSVFQGATYRWQRLRMPMEWTCWVVRALDGDATSPSNLDGVIGTTDRMGQNLFHYPSPDGYPTLSLRQPGSQVYVDAARHAQDFLRTLPPYTGRVIHDLPGMVQNGIGTLIPNGNPASPNDVAHYFLRRLFLGKWTADDLTRLKELTEATISGVPAPLDPNIPTDYAQRIHLLAALAVVMPQGLEK